MATLPIAPAVRRLIQVKGIVQGVGFRPFVYALAQSLSLTGHVFNTSAGVTIEIEGELAAVDLFLRDLSANPPYLAELAGISVREIEPRGDSVFSILSSHGQLGEFALVSPDAGTCDACWDDVGDPLNRRYGYPFTNCTHCGPRYTIIRDVPYDRASTTMADFTMCPACAAEYADPADRRFHAQPNACPVCGPSLALVGRGEALGPDLFADRNSLENLHKARALLHEGRILAIKGLGGFLLACDAANEAAVAELRRRKQRPAKPFALMVRDFAAVKLLCEVCSGDEAALLHLRRPIVIMPRIPTAPIAASIAPGNNTVGVMLPYTPLHYLLFSDSPDQASEFPALVMTSGNLSEEPIVVSNRRAMQHLGSVADWFLLHNREIAMRVDDSVVRTFEGRERVLRRSRGYVPHAIDLGRSVSELVAFGGELKNTFCLTKGRHAILSQHIGDLQNFETEEFFQETLARMQSLFRVEPRAVAHDLHPGYRSTRMALASGIERRFAVQHHHAHIASCMAENHLGGEVIGVAFDGTGYGSDGCIWGGEFLVASLSQFTRRAHLRYVPLPGGDAAVRQPWRMALSYLRDAFGPRSLPPLACFESVPPRQFELVDAILAKRIQTVETSSAGRLFDAVAALLGLASEVTFEAQAAIALETAAAPQTVGSYPFDLQTSGSAGEASSDVLIVDLRATIVSIVEAITAGRPVAEIAARFHNTLSTAIAEGCSRIRISDGLRRVCLSGGTFQNLYLLQRTAEELRRRDFEVFLHATVPANDGGISLGQAVIADEILRTGG
jgi:hydrogenase maturation protein HypF